MTIYLRAIPTALIATFILLSLNSCSLLAPSVTSEFSQLRAGQYQLDPQHASLAFKVSHLGLSSYVGRFNRFDASLDFDPADIGSAQLQASIHTASIDSNNAKLDETLRGSSWLDSDSFPEARFNSTSVTATGSGFNFNGDLTLRGVSYPISLHGEFLGAAVNRLNGRYTLGFRAKGSINRSDFGIDSYLAMIGDQVTLEIEAEFLRQ